MIKEIPSTEKIQICDICGNAVGELQRTRRSDTEHYCFMCMTISWMVKEAEHAKECHESEYYRRESFAFDFDKFKELILNEAKHQAKENGRYDDNGNLIQSK